LNYSAGVPIVTQEGCMELRDDTIFINILINITINVYTYQNAISMVCSNEYNI